jgi:hypothetical protein
MQHGNNYDHINWSLTTAINAIKRAAGPAYVNVKKKTTAMELSKKTSKKTPWEKWEKLVLKN